MTLCEYIPSDLNELDEQEILDRGGIRHCYAEGTYLVSYADELCPDEIDDFYFCDEHINEAILSPVMNGYEPIIVKL